MTGNNKNPVIPSEKNSMSNSNFERSGIQTNSRKKVRTRRQVLKRKRRMAGKDTIERRSTDRVRDDSLLIVTGDDRRGLRFEQRARIKDVSPGGISFILTIAVDAGSLVDLRICSEPAPGGHSLLECHVKARVLRVCLEKQTPRDTYLVAARFEGEVLDMSEERGFEALVRELQKAVEHDESNRYRFE